LTTPPKSNSIGECDDLCRGIIYIFQTTRIIKCWH
jgi:hypothetical protein